MLARLHDSIVRDVNKYSNFVSIPDDDNCAAGVRLDGFLAESEGLSGDLGLRHFAN